MPIFITKIFSMFFRTGVVARLSEMGKVRGKLGLPQADEMWIGIGLGLLVQLVTRENGPIGSNSGS